MFTTNAGTADRVFRVAVGVLLLSLVFFGPKTPWGWLGLVALATGLIGWCPLYSVLGFNTCPASRTK